MTWLGILILLVAAYLAYKLMGVLFKLLMLVIALFAGYWLLAPVMGWPTVREVVYVLGPDIDGRPVEEALQPGELARRAGDHVVGKVVDHVGRNLQRDPDGVGAADPPSHTLETAAEAEARRKRGDAGPELR